MRILIYFLAMLTGFSAAEAARPVSAVPASVDASVSRAYAAATVNVVQDGRFLRASSASVRVVPSIELPAVAAFSAMVPSTPVLRHDVLLA